MIGCMCVREKNEYCAKTEQAQRKVYEIRFKLWTHTNLFFSLLLLHRASHSLFTKFIDDGNLHYVRCQMVKQYHCMFLMKCKQSKFVASFSIIRINPTKLLPDRLPNDGMLHYNNEVKRTNISFHFIS